MQVHAIIIDDESHNIENLELLLQQHCPQLTVVATATNATDGGELIQQHRPDIVFLDIHMPGKSGFDMLRSLRRHDFELIFATAFDQYGIEAIRFSAIDYLLKPINPDELVQAVHKAIYRSAERRQNQKLENLLVMIGQQQQKEQHRIALPSARETRFIKPGDILRCESSNNYTTFFLIDGQKIMTSKPIFEYDEMLQPYGFLRCHQSHLVNRAHVKSWVKDDGGFLLLDDDTQVPVSRQKKEFIRRELEGQFKG